ncbi:MAG: hypothetical protein SFV18_09430 [Bryobacteraceae bacterium]|nr:hypothetical protein [Bryobacteraceae bacterium]
MIRYPVPWDLVFGLTPYIANKTRRDVDDFSANVVARMLPAPEYRGLQNIPRDGRFIVAPNHYQREGLWILHSASAVTQAVRRAIGPGNPPVHWIVTANWPPWKIGPWTVPSPGDILLPKVAYALHCFPVSFVKTNPAFTATSIRRLLKAAPTLSRPIGIFPEGVAGEAGTLTDPLPGVERLLVKLARPVVPVRILETDRLVVEFGEAIPASELASAPDAARLTMSRIAAIGG